MSKRGIIFAILVVSVFISMSFSLTSAFSFSDLFDNVYSKITGKVTYEPSLDNGLIAYYKFDDNSLDSSGNGINGAVGGSPIYVSGKFGNAIDFNGINQYVTFANSNSPKLKNNHTISGWIYLKSNIASAAIISKWCGLCYSGVYNARSYALGITNGKLEYALSTASGQLNSGFHSFLSNSALPVNQWVFFTVTYNGVRRTTYINGIEENYVDRPGDVYQSNADVEIGATRDAGYRGFFNGSIDELRFYNRTLSASEVQQLYSTTTSSCIESWQCGSWSSCSNSQQTRTCIDSNSCGTTNSKPSITQSCTVQINDISNGLVAYYKLDDNSSSTSVVDSSGNGINGISRRATSSMAATGQINGALNFNGAGDYINLGNGLNFGGNSFTVSAWVKPALIKGRSGTAQNIFVQRTNCGTGNIQLYLEDGYTCGSKPNIDFWNSNSFGANPMLCGTTAPIAARWYNLVGVYNSTDLILYIDGVKDNSKQASGNVNTAAVSSILGWDTCGSNYFNGLIDEVRIYNRALSASEAGLLYNSIPTISQNITTNITQNITTNLTTNLTIQNLTTNLTIENLTITSNLTTNISVENITIPVECPLYSPISCENGVIVSSGIDSNGCGLPLVCVVGQDISIVDSNKNICKGCLYNNTCMPVGYRILVEDTPSYCDISGIVSQKKNTENFTQSCQNSFECDSNLCSAGECVEIIGTKAFFVKLVCRLANINDETKYLSCIDQYIYGVNSTQNITQNTTQIQPSQTTPSCISNWSCGAWSLCDENNNKTRICYDGNNCGIDEDKPTISENCNTSISQSSSSQTSQIVEVTLTEQNFTWWNPSTWTGVTNNP